MQVAPRAGEDGVWEGEGTEFTSLLPDADIFSNCYTSSQHIGVGGVDDEVLRRVDW
jgi:hypothetical protein